MAAQKNETSWKSRFYNELEVVVVFVCVWEGVTVAQAIIAYHVNVLFRKTTLTVLVYFIDPPPTRHCAQWFCHIFADSAFGKVIFSNKKRSAECRPNNSESQGGWKISNLVFQCWSFFRFQNEQKAFLLFWGFSCFNHAFPSNSNPQKKVCWSKACKN